MEILIDTNIALYLLGGDKQVARLLDDEIINLSFITQLELLAYPEITQEERAEVESFLNEVVIIDVNHDIKMHAVDIRKQSALKLPDAIIAGTARSQKIPLFSADQAFKKVKDLQLFSYQL